MPDVKTILLNKKAGQLMQLAKADISALVEHHLGPGVDIILREPPEFFQALEEAFSAENEDTIVVGGGDGTVSAAAALALAKNRTLGILPLGTMNLLARAFGMPLELEPALEALAETECALIDVGMMNDRPFFNHVSVGVHPRMIRIRDQQGYSGQLSKLAGGVKALARAFEGAAANRLSIVSKSQTLEVNSAGVAITVNPIPEAPLQLPFRPHQRYGRLGCYVLPELNTSELVELVRELIAGHWSTARNLTFLESTGFTVSGDGSFHISVDGEVELHEGEINCQIHPSSLKVLVPKSD